MILLATGVQGRGLPVPDLLFFFFFGAGPLYFVGALVQLLALFAFLAPPARAGRLLLAGFAVSAVTFAAADFATWTTGAVAGIFETHLNRFFPAWSVFFAGGVLLGRSDAAFGWVARRRIPLAVLAAVSAAAYLAELGAAGRRFGFHPVRQFLLAGLPLQLAGGLLFLDGLRTLDRSGRARGLLARLAAAGPDTFGIYLSHVSVQSALFALWVAAGHDTADWWEVPVLAVASWIVCRAGVRVMRRVRIPEVPRTP